VVEKYISPWVIPGEKILGYVKWNPGCELKRAEIRAPENTDVRRILNVGAGVFANHAAGSPSYVITKDQIQVEGFMGFEAVYMRLPETEVKATFEVTIVFEDMRKEQVALTAEVIRPLLTSIKPSVEILSSRESPKPGAIMVGIVNAGKGDVLEGSLKPFIETIQGKELKIQIETHEEKYGIGDTLFVEDNQRSSSKIVINGRGYGMIRLGFSYSDRLGNVYKNGLLDVMVTVEDKKTLEVPLGDAMVSAGGPFPVLQPPVLA